MKKVTSLILFIMLVFSSCIKDINTNPDTSNFNYPGNWAVPLVHARINLGNLVESDSLVSVDPDGLIHVIYREDSLFSQNVYDYTTVPEQDPVSTNFKIGDPLFNLNTNLGTFGGAKMKSITLSSGKLFWDIKTTATDTIQLYVKIANTDLNGQTAVFNLKAIGPNSVNGEINIAGLKFDLTQGTPAYNNIGFEVGILNADTSVVGSDVDVTLAFDSLGIESAIGFFGERSIEVPSGVFPTNLSILNNINGGLHLANPEIKIFSKSNIGLPLSIAANIIGVNADNESVNLGLQPYLFTGAQTIGTYQQDTFKINVGNSNITDFIANVPADIIFSGNVDINPNGEPANDNFITNDGELIVGLEVDLPLELKTKDLTIEQTIRDIDFGVDKEEEDYIEELSIGFRIENAFPLDADLHFYFQDSLGTIIDSSEIALFDAAIIDVNGNVTAPAKADRYLKFTNDKIKNILKSKDIRIKVILNTSNNGDDVVRLLTEYYMDLIVGIRVKANYTNKGE